MITDHISWGPLMDGSVRAVGYEGHEEVPLMTITFHNQFLRLTKEERNSIMEEAVAEAVDLYQDQVFKEKI